MASNAISIYAVAVPVDSSVPTTSASLSSSSIKAYLKGLPKIPNVLMLDVPKLMKEAPAKIADAVTDLAFQFTDQKYLLPSQSNFVPVEEIGEPLGVTIMGGRIPEGFPEGIYIRNGPNPPFGSLKSSESIFGKTSDLWVEGEGMNHSLHFSKDGSGKWNILYNNKYVQTDTLRIEMERNRRSFVPATEGDSPAIVVASLVNSLRFGTVNRVLSNTNVFEHAGKYYSTAENHMPQEIDIVTLETLGNWDLIATAWNRPLNSHPKKAPGTGELVIGGIDAVKPYHVVGIISADGDKIIHKVDLKYNRCTLCHEVGVTERYTVILDFPLKIDPARLLMGGPLMRLDSDEFARIGVMPRYGDADSIKWFEVEPCSVFHLVNCYEDGDDVVIIGCKARAAIIPGPDFGREKYEWFSRGFKPLNLVNKNDGNSVDGALFTRVHEWRLNMKNGEVNAKNLTGTDFSMDFPIINENFVGIKNRYGFAQVVDSMASSIAGLAKYGGLAKIYLDEREVHNSSMENGTLRVEYHKFPNNTYCTGAAFVPKLGGLEEDDGWVISFVHSEDTNTSQAYIVDAKKFSSEPVAEIGIPGRVPYGFHGAYMPLNSKNTKISYRLSCDMM